MTGVSLRRHSGSQCRSFSISGAAIGAAAGGISGALTDLGIDDEFMKDLAKNLQPGNAALFLLIRKMTLDKVLKALEGTGGVVFKTSFDESREHLLRQALEGAAAAAA